MGYVRTSYFDMAEHDEVEIGVGGFDQHRWYFITGVVVRDHDGRHWSGRVAISTGDDAGDNTEEFNGKTQTWIEVEQRTEMRPVWVPVVVRGGEEK